MIQYQFKDLFRLRCKLSNARGFSLNGTIVEVLDNPPYNLEKMGLNHRKPLKLILRGCLIDPRYPDEKYDTVVDVIDVGYRELDEKRRRGNPPRIFYFRIPDSPITPPPYRNKVVGIRRNY
ncbi:MAG: hypothetical protein QXY45_03035 [Candidatus Aenigmatarchaeota archaeon]